MEQQQVQPVEKPSVCPVPKRWRWVGAAAFTFFLVKGLLWLAIPTLVAMGLLSK